jgi:A/G-specific adenine glycosylase
VHAKPSDIAPALLAWYDAHARTLPWRTPPGGKIPDPYRVWLSEVMLQQTGVETVRPRFAEFLARWPSVEMLAAADDSDVMAAWAGLGYYARARNLIACAREAVRRGGFPDTEAELRTLPGVGGYTAAAIAAIAFGRRAVVVDANVERVVARLFAVEVPLPAAKREIYAHMDALTPDVRAGDFAQAMMDHGSAICVTPVPRCLACPIADACAGFRSGAPERYPVKPPKSAKPQRYGTIFWAERDGNVLLVRRPSKGLLGGMRALPTGAWEGAPPGLAGAPFDEAWRPIDVTVTHVFTHFRLDLALAVANTREHAPPDGEWWPVDRLAEAGLPTVFAKAADAIRRAI